MLPKNDKLQYISYGHCSMPASPEEMEHRIRGKMTKRDLPVFHSPVQEKKTFSYCTGFVRTSKSEDHLQKSSLSTVNIDIEDEMASSLNTLLDTKHDNTTSEKLVWTCDNEEKSVSLESIEISNSKSSNKISSSSSSSSETSISLNANLRKKYVAHKEELENISDSSDSEIIPSDSSTSTIRKGDSENSDRECTSEQISAISSLDDITPDDFDLDSPADTISLTLNHSPENWELDADFNEMLENEENTSKGTETLFNESNKDSSDITNGCANHHVCFNNNEKLLNVRKDFMTVSKCDCNFLGIKTEQIGSPTSFGSEDTFGEVSYHELTESYDEDSFIEVEEESIRSSSPTDDESDIESLHSFRYSPKAVDMPSASRLAKRLFHLEGFKKTDVSRHLSKNNEFSQVVAEQYVSFFDFSVETLDVALRKFLKQFCLTGETQERERVLIHFSKRYLDCNPGSFKSQDAVHTLTCALMLLNSDLHGDNVCRKMACREFIENLAELNDGENFPREVLKALYYSIKIQPLQWSSSDEPEEKESHETSSQSTSLKSYMGQNPFLEVPNPNCAIEYKKGYVMRKCCLDPSGKKTPLGKRGWKMLYSTLKDLILYLHKDEHGFKKNQLYDSLHNSIRIHHSLAIKAADYTKKQFVFRLHTADHAEFLFQTSDSKELQSWVDTINLVSASLSAPPLACAVGSQKKFQRPLLPVSHTKLNLREQLQDHENRIVWLEKELEEHVSRTFEKGNRSRFIQEYSDKEQHLQFELTRYRTYAFLLRSKMAQYPELEVSLVETSIGEIEEPSDVLNKPTSRLSKTVNKRHSGQRRHISQPVKRNCDGCG